MAWVLYRSTDRFAIWSADPRVRYEPGAEAMAAEVADALPAAIQIVEQRLNQPFLGGPTTFVCARPATYKSFVGAVNATSGGCVINRRLFLSPKPENTAERIPRLLAHELTHLHVEQRIGLMRVLRLPFWFNEGLAVFVSDGGGAEDVTDAQARTAIAEGRTFVPEGNIALFYRRVPSHYRLSPHLFYREAGMFVGDFARRDEDQFHRFVRRIERSQLLDEAFSREYGMTIAAAWERFVADVQAAPR
jgi:hypothetical protein